LSDLKVQNNSVITNF